MLKIANLVMPNGIAHQWQDPVDWENFRWQVNTAKNWGATHISVPCWGQHSPSIDLPKVDQAIKIVEQEYGLSFIIWIDKWITLNPELWAGMYGLLEKFNDGNRIIDIAREPDKTEMALDVVVNRIWDCKIDLHNKGLVVPHQLMFGGGTVKGTVSLEKAGPGYLSHTLYSSVGYAPLYDPDNPREGAVPLVQHLKDIKEVMDPNRKLIVIEFGWSDWVAGLGRMPHLLANMYRHSIWAAQMVQVDGLGFWCISDQANNPDRTEAYHGVIDADTAEPKPGVLEALLTWNR